MDTSDPPGNEQPAADYLQRVLESEGIAVQTFEKVEHRPNIVARLPGNGRKRPLLLMAHTDVVNVDPTKWTHPPFAAERDGGYVYGRGTVDDKDNVTAALMTMLVLKRANVPLDRDVIFLAEAGEEGNTWLGIEHMVNEHFGAIDAEYCFAEGGGVTRAERQGALRDGRHGREGAERHRSRRARHVGARLDAAADERDRASREGRGRGHRVAAARGAQRYDARVFHAARGDLERRGRAPLPRRLELRPEGRCCGGRMAPRERAAARVDAAHVAVAEHRARRLSQQRDSVRGQGHARRPDAARRELRGVPRAGEQGRERSGRRGAVQRLAADEHGQAADRRRLAHRQRGVRAPWSARSRSTTTPPCCR